MQVRCDGVHPNCTRCLTTGVLCAYPSSRRSRNTQPTNVDPFIENLSNLEAKIRRIESDLEAQRALIHSVFIPNQQQVSARNNKGTPSPVITAAELTDQMRKTEQEVQESRSILAQLRLRGEQRIARSKRSMPKQQQQQRGGSSSDDIKLGKHHRALSSDSSGNKKTKMVETKNSSSSSSSACMYDQSFYFDQHHHHLITPPPLTSDAAYLFPVHHQQQQHEQAQQQQQMMLRSPFSASNDCAEDHVSLLHQQQQQGLAATTGDWPLFHQLTHAPNHPSPYETQPTTIINDSGFFEEQDMSMVAAAAAAAQQHGIAPPLLSVTRSSSPATLQHASTNYFMMDELLPVSEPL